MSSHKEEIAVFDKLSMLAKYDDITRTCVSLIQLSNEDEKTSIAMLAKLQRRFNDRELVHEKDKENLKGEINALEGQVRKLNRQLTESRKALVREADERKREAREKKALLDQIRQVRQLVEKESYIDADAHRKRVIKCLGVEHLSTINSDDSDDCVSGLEYDRTEEDILDADRSPPRRSTAFDDALESLQPNEQPTLLYRYLDRDKNSDDLQNNYKDHDHHEGQRDELRRSTRLASHRRSAQCSSNPPTSATSSSNQHDKFADLNLDTDTNSMDTDDNDIEKWRQQLQKCEAEKREKLAASNSTPNIKGQKKGATLSARSTANLIKSISSVATPVANALKPHSFVSKKSFKPEYCVPCGGKVGFYSDCVKCEVCGVISHPDCKERCPLPCVKITAPNTRSRQKKILISDYVNNDAVPKVPALIVHCCNEIERDDNIITPGLYRVVSLTKDIEELQQKILKSKSGMPNLSKINVHLLTGVVKRFLQGLDESLITTTLWSHFSEAIKLNPEEAKTHMSYYIGYDLPTANRDTLSYLMQHLHAIARHSNENMMTKENLAKTMAPTLIGNSCRNPPPQTISNETKIQIQITETLLDIEEEFWARFVSRPSPTSAQTASLGSRLLSETPRANRKTRGSRIGSTLPTPKLKPLFS